MAEVRKLHRLGNSYAIYVPVKYLDQFGLKKGSFIIITLERDGILLRPLALAMTEKEIIL